MPHIHTEPGQHDMTVSGYIIRKDENGKWRCLLHVHRKIDKLMQIGGHIELDQTPWQAMAAELKEEAGYDLAELRVLQWAEVPQAANRVTHPLPFLLNTHMAGENHYHSDLCFGFLAEDVPQHAVAAGESADLRWLNLSDINNAVAQGDALGDVYDVYSYLIALFPTLLPVPAGDFSLDKPTGGVVYQR